MKLLIVDDEILIRDVLKEYAYHENYEVLEAADGLEAIDQVKKHPDLKMIILDIMMPKMDGFEVAREIRKTSNVPIIMLSARGEEYDKLQGFDLGIDDYITKPFSPKEVMARIKAILKRTKEEENKEQFIYQDLCIDYKAHTVKIADEELKLTPKEYDLLVYFVQNQNIALSREQLLSNLWGYDFFGEDRTIDTHIKMLRNNLGKYRDLIVTVRGLGYKFELK